MVLTLQQQAQVYRTKFWSRRLQPADSAAICTPPLVLQALARKRYY